MKVQQYRALSLLLAWPPPLSLLVSLTLQKETGAFIQCAPKFGESGWMHTQLGVWGSGLPPGTHSPLTYFHLWLSPDTKSSNKEYMAFGSSPDTFTFSTGNMRLNKKKERSRMIYVVLHILFDLVLHTVCLYLSSPAILCNYHFICKILKLLPKLVLIQG